MEFQISIIITKRGRGGGITNRVLLIILVTPCIENRVTPIDDAIIYKDLKVRNIFTGWFY